MALEKTRLERLAAAVQAQAAERRHYRNGVRAPIDPEEIEAVEAELGFELHPDLVLVYETIANGGFGPDYRLLGIGRNGHPPYTAKTADVEYRDFRMDDSESPGWFWPEGVLPIHYWGCGIYSCVDCRSADGAILRFDPNGADGDWSIAWQVEGRTFALWLSRWLDGEDLSGCEGPFWTEAESRSTSGLDVVSAADAPKLGAPVATFTTLGQLALEERVGIGETMLDTALTVRSGGWSALYLDDDAIDAISDEELAPEGPHNQLLLVHLSRAMPTEEEVAKLREVGRVDIEGARFTLANATFAPSLEAPDGFDDYLDGVHGSFADGGGVSIMLGGDGVAIVWAEASDKPSVILVDFA